MFVWSFIKKKKCKKPRTCLINARLVSINGCEKYCWRVHWYGKRFLSVCQVLNVLELRPCIQLMLQCSFIKMHEYIISGLDIACFICILFIDIFFLYLYVAYFFLWGVYTRWIKQVKQQVYCREFHSLATGWRARQWSRSRQNKNRRTRSLLICLHAKLAAGLPFYRLSPFIDIVSVFFIRLSFCIAHLVSAVVSRWRCLLKKGERGRGWFMNHAWSAISPCSCLRRHHVCLC